MMMVKKILVKIMLIQMEMKSCDDDLQDVPKKIPFWNSFIIGPKLKKVFETKHHREGKMPCPPKMYRHKLWQ